MELDREEQVVVEVRDSCGRAGDVCRAAEAEREAQVVNRHGLGRVGLVDVLGGRRQVVHHPVHPVVLLDAQREGGRLGRGQLLFAENLARLLHAHLELIVGVHDAVAAQHLAQVLRRHHHVGWLAKRKRVVLVRQLRQDGPGRLKGRVNPKLSALGGAAAAALLLDAREARTVGARAHGPLAAPLAAAGVCMARHSSAAKALTQAAAQTFQGGPASWYSSACSL